MEEDFRVFSQDMIEKIKKFEIPYKWRDSCVEDMIDWRACEEKEGFIGRYTCLGFRQVWEECQIKRERKIIATENLTPVPEERRRQSY
jgi:hypothetical protein